MSRFAAGNASGTAVLTLALLTLVLGACSTLSGAVRTDSSLLAASPVSGAPGEAVATVVSLTLAEAHESPGPAEVDDVEGRRGATPEGVTPGGDEGEDLGDQGAALIVAQLQQAPGDKPASPNDEEVEEEYDPWEPFNETMFEVNRKLDKYVLKPAATVYDKIMPEPWQVLIANGFDNIAFVPRAVNSLLQGKWGGAGREVSRFLINSTLGIGGLFDAAKYWGIEKSREDFGQTLAVWGAGPGPYLILPLFPPLTVRDAIGKALDSAMDPLGYFLPLLWTRVGMKAGETVNERSLNLDLYQGFEESVIDMYSAVRNAYLRRREQLIKE